MKKKVVFASVIDQDHHATFSRTLLLLEYPFEAVLATNPRDTEGDGSKLPGPTLSPAQLLAQTRPHEQNEVVLEGSRLKIVGAGLRVLDTPEGSNYPPDSPRFRTIAEQLSVPLLEFHEVSDRPDSPTRIVRPGVVMLEHGGMRYCFSSLLDDDSYMTPDELSREDLATDDYFKLCPYSRS